MSISAMEVEILRRFISMGDEFSVCLLYEQYQGSKEFVDICTNFNCNVVKMYHAMLNDDYQDEELEMEVEPEPQKVSMKERYYDLDERFGNDEYEWDEGDLPDRGPDVIERHIYEVHETMEVCEPLIERNVNRISYEIDANTEPVVIELNSDECWYGSETNKPVRELLTSILQPECDENCEQGEGYASALYEFEKYNSISIGESSDSAVGASSAHGVHPTRHSDENDVYPTRHSDESSDEKKKSLQ